MPFMPQSLETGRPEWLSKSPGALGRYLLGPSLGKGGMGEVFEAWDPMLCRRVALKVLYFRDIGTITRFMKEAQLQAKVNHPNLCQVFDVDIDNGRPFIAMQLIRGQSMVEAADGLSVQVVAELFMLVAEAVHVAHRAKLVHRDLKPSNILLEPRPDGTLRPIVCDFGLAMEVGEPGLTLSHALVGTPAFMAPEQVRGDRSLIGPSTDVYALGATFYEVFLGRPTCMTLDDSDLLAIKIERKFPRPRQVKSDLPQELETILLKCLEPVQANRYASAAALAEDLRRFLEGEPIVAHPAGPIALTLRRARRHPGVTVVLLVATLGGLTALGWGLWTRIQSRSQVESAQRFGSLAKDLEYMLRMERMLPPHDLRPLREHTLRRMEDLQRSLARLGPGSQGPARLALARGHLALRQPDAAVLELDAAWASGYRTPEVAYALARAHCEAFVMKSDREALELGEESLESLRERHLKKARTYLDQAGSADWEPLALGEAVLLNQEERFSEALVRCGNISSKDPWLYEAKVQEAQAWVGIGFQAQMSGNAKSAAECYAAADRAIQAAMMIGRSDEGIYQVALNHRLARIGGGNPFGVPGSSQLREISGWVDSALQIGPDNPRAWADKLTLRCREVEGNISAGQNPTFAIREALGWIEGFKGRGSSLVAVGAQKAAWLHLLQADWDEATGKDSLPEIEKALGCKPRGFLGMLAAMRRAESCLSHHEDPTRWVSQSMEFRKTIKLPDFSIGQAMLAGHGHSLQAAWKMARGEDPTTELLASETELEKALKDRGKSPIPSAYLAEVCCLRLESGKGDPADALRKGREAAQAVLTLPGATFRELGEVANLGLAASRWALRTGQASPDLGARGRDALRRGLARYPRCERLLAVKRGMNDLRSSSTKRTTNSSAPSSPCH